MHYAVEMPLSINERRWAENKKQRQSGLSLKQSGPVKTKPAPAQDDDDLDDFMDLAGSFKEKFEEPEKVVKEEHKVVKDKQKE